MNILFLNGSPKKDGNTARVMKRLRDGISPEHDLEWIDVYDLSFRPCLGCMGCRPNKPCVLPEDDAHRVGRMIEKADALVVGTPNYWGNMSGPLKNLFDRSVTVFETFGAGLLPKPRHRGKKALIVTSSGTPWPLNLLPSQSGGSARAVKTVLSKVGFAVQGIVYYGGAKPGDPVSGPIQKQVFRLAKKVSKG